MENPNVNLLKQNHLVKIKSLSSLKMILVHAVKSNLDSNELCNALHGAIKKQTHSVQLAGIIHELNQTGVRLSEEDEGLVLDYIQFFRNCNVLRWGLNTHATNAEPPFMHLTKYG